MLKLLAQLDDLTAAQASVRHSVQPGARAVPGIAAGLASSIILLSQNSSPPQTPPPAWVTPLLHHPTLAGLWWSRQGSESPGSVSRRGGVRQAQPALLWWLRMEQRPRVGTEHLQSTATLLGHEIWAKPRCLRAESHRGLWGDVCFPPAALVSVQGTEKLKLKLSA